MNASGENCSHLNLPKTLATTEAHEPINFHTKIAVKIKLNNTKTHYHILI